MIRAVLVFLILLPSPAFAWNALGHKVVAEIAWQQLVPSERQSIVEVLRRHPRFAEDFVKKMPAEVGTADSATQGHWAFQHAATWPDQIRGNREYDQPIWHYVDFPLFIGRKRPTTFNLSMRYPTRIEQKDYNVAQATKHTLAAIKSDAGPDVKAIAYCWLFHLVGDMHQPLHSTALVCDQFPDGDRGGNDIPLVRGRNLHSLWDNLLGQRHYMRDVEREMAELKADKTLWEADRRNIDGWIAESHDLAKSFVYDPIILKAVSDAQRGSRLAPIDLPESYMKDAGRIARQRIIAAGLRLGALLKQN
jgi:hypothetical protein